MVKTAFGKENLSEKSYTYAVASVYACPRQALSGEQWKRLYDADYDGALKLLFEAGYGGGETEIFEMTENEMDYVNRLILDIAPDDDLTGTMLFELDALNLKLFIKAKKVNREVSPKKAGYFPLEILHACTEADDYSLIGCGQLSGVINETDAMIISNRVDTALFLRSLENANQTLRTLFEAYGVCRNRLLSARLVDLKIDFPEKKQCFLPVEWTYYRRLDEGKNPDEIRRAAWGRFKYVLDGIRVDSNGIGPLAGYYFSKKIEAENLRLMLTQKSAGRNAVIYGTEGV